MYYEVSATQTDGSNYYTVAIKNSDVYASNDPYQRAGTTYTINASQDQYFIINSTKALTYNSTDYQEDALVVSYLGGGRYPNDTTERTVSSYTPSTMTLVIAETTLTTAMI